MERYPAEWSPDVYKIGVSGNQYMASGGLVHNYRFNNRVSLRTSLGMVYSNNDLAADSVESIQIPNLNLHNRSYQVNASARVNYTAGSRHTNRSGINWTSTFYNFFYKEWEPVEGVTQRKIGGHTALLSGFSNSLIQVNERIRLNLGVNGQIFLLNRH